MSTNSELLTEIISKNIFFTSYVFSSIKFKQNSIEQELCDCILEFNDYYICIQIKEKSEFGQSSDYNWFKKKVLKKAVSQMKTTIKNINDGSYEFYLNSDDKYKKIILNSNKSIIPVIIFYNVNLLYYDRFYFSKTSNYIINIFSYEDFKTMLDSLKLPFDIVLYLLDRHIHIQANGESRLVFEDINDKTSIISKLQTEKELSDFYLLRNYYDKNIKIENIEFYNSFLKNIYNDYSNYFPSLFQLLLSVDAVLSDKIVDTYCFIVKNIKSKKLFFPLFIKSKDTTIMFIRKPYQYDEKMFKNAIENLSLYYCYKYNLKKAYVLIFNSEINNKFSINVGYKDFDLPKYDNELEILVKDIEHSFGINKV